MTKLTFFEEERLLAVDWHPTLVAAETVLVPLLKNIRDVH